MNNYNFETTAANLLECYKHMDDELTPSEEKAKQKLIRLCKQLVEEHGDKSK